MSLLDLEKPANDYKATLNEIYNLFQEGSQLAKSIELAKKFNVPDTDPLLQKWITRLSELTKRYEELLNT